ncbi:hypothetical protein GCM10027051_13160 [Niabella terrae]
MKEENFRKNDPKVQWGYDNLQPARGCNSGSGSGGHYCVINGNMNNDFRHSGAQDKIAFKNEQIFF